MNRRPDRVERRARHRGRRLGVDVRGTAGAVVARAPGAGRATVGRTCWGRPPGSRSTGSSSTRGRADALARLGLADRIANEPHWSIAARAIELVHAVAEAIDIVDAYEPPAEAAIPWTPRAGTAAWATEAPRGLLFHATSSTATATSSRRGSCRRRARTRRPSRPTSRSSPRPSSTGPTTRSTHLLEQLIRSYDPCISCATHFLELEVEDVP